MVIDKPAYDASADRVARILKTIEDTIQDLREGWERVVPIVLASIRQNFTVEGRPAWAPLAPRTRAERSRQGFDPAHPILVRTGELMREATGEGSHHMSWIAKPAELSFRTDPLFEKFQQHNGLQLYDRIYVPARPFFFIQEEDERPILEALALFVTKRIQAAVL